MSSTITALTSGGGLAMAGDTSGQLELKTNNGTTAVTIATDQTATFAGNAVFANNNYTGFKNTSGSATCSIFQDTSNDFWMYNGGATNTRFYTNAAERMRIDSSGYTYINTTNLYNNCRLSVAFNGATGNSIGCQNTDTGSSSQNVVFFYRNGTGTGTISHTNSATAYNTSSDYRLKENVQPMTGALNKIAQLKPVTFNWISSQNSDNGFIAHELAEVCPNAVHGEKDAVDEENKPIYQGVDTSFLVATLTAAIQELNAKVDAQALEIQALKGVA